ncbi:hypothetical protein EYC80_005327 [Monilinia laxa]|uniref:Large-conductance mechanosensitive channel n=1 Tax=Monilinia laxa TaxID=61186 RepID=A0A5N6KJK6_MONLA|nr:hypothetical protein EYC80_005327 [Monilinia laxa]
MPRPSLDFDARAASEPLLRTTHAARKHLTSFWDGFVDFAFNDNVLHVAIGLIIAQSFTTLITSLVSSVLLPPLSLLPFLNKNLDEKFAVLRPGPHYGGTLHNHTEVGGGVGEGVEGNGTAVFKMGIEFLYGAGYNTLKQALDDGAIVLAWGSFINKLINFIGVGLALIAARRFSKRHADAYSVPPGKMDEKTFDPHLSPDPYPNNCPPSPESLNDMQRRIKYD